MDLIYLPQSSGDNYSIPNTSEVVGSVVIHNSEIRYINADLVNILDPNDEYSTIQELIGSIGFKFDLLWEEILSDENIKNRYENNSWNLQTHRIDTGEDSIVIIEFIKKQPIFESSMLDYFHRFQHIITVLSKNFIKSNPDSIDDEIDLALRRVGEFIGVDRSYLFQVNKNDNKISNTHEWVNTGIIPMKDNLQDLPPDLFGWLDKELRNNKVIKFSDITNMPDPAQVDKQRLMDQGIKSILILPLYFGNDYLGFIGFDSVKTWQNWSVPMVSVLQILGEIIVYSLKRVQMEFELKKNEQKYRRLFQNSMIAIYTSTPEGKIIDFNNHLSNLLGYTQQELNRMAMSDLFYDEKDLDHLIETLNEINLMDNVEIKFKHKDGTIIHTLTTMRLIQEGGHSIIHGITKDVTELRETTEKLYKSEKLKSLGIMAGGIAHDFNNLLTSIRGYTELSEPLVHNAELKSYLDNIKQNTTRAIRLTSKLLSYAGEGIFITETTNLAQKVSEERNYYQNTIQKNKLRFEIKDTDYVDIDYSGIDQVIMNFLSNASEVTEVHDEIVLTTGKTDAKTIQRTNYDLILNPDPIDGEYAFLAVQDYGTGIASENLESIFEPYFTTKFQGRGLGLSASWGIVKNHNGIVAVNTSAEGTTMTVFIPLSTHNTETSVEKLEIIEEDKNILIVDDEPSVRDITTKILENMNYNTIALPNGEDILKVLTKLSIDLIIIDQTMPGKTGIEIISEIRENRIEIPVILTSGYSADDYMDKLEQLEIIQFLHKPYSVDELKTVVSKTIQP